MFWRKKKATAESAEPAQAPAAALVDPDLERAHEAAAELLRALGRHAFDVGATPAAAIAFVRCLGRASLEQGKTSIKLRSGVERLRASVESNSLEALKSSALEVAEAVTQALEEQEERARMQTNELRDKLARVEGHLEEAHREGSTDALTQLQNRRVFDIALERAVALATVVERPFSLVIVDIDHFKAVNDRFGHPVGDRVLRAVADTLARAFPRRGDVVTRYGGEEFAVLLGETSKKDAKMLTDRVDRALYAAKTSGRDRLVIADGSPDRSSSRPSARNFPEMHRRSSVAPQLQRHDE